MAIYKRGRGFGLGTTEKQIQVVVRAGLKPGTAGLRVRLADHPATLAPWVIENLHGELQGHAFEQLCVMSESDANKPLLSHSEAELNSFGFLPFSDPFL